MSNHERLGGEKNPTQKELLEILMKNTKELNNSIKDILENGTLEQKVDLLVSDYINRINGEEFRLKSELQNSISYSSSVYPAPWMPKF